MGEISTTDAQRLIDAKAYPPTHTYDLATLIPRYPLNHRLSILLRVCPDMFKANRFLDVGCSKGFFALKAAKESSSVLAIDPDEEALKSWESVCPKNVTQKVGTFKDVSGEFDMVWIGNGHHYLYREDRNYVDRLKRIATDRVLIEGPTGPKRFEMRNFGPHQTEVELLESMQDFYLVRRAESETKGRAVWLFKTRS